LAEFKDLSSLTCIYLRELSQYNDEMKFVSLAPTELPKKEERGLGDCCEESYSISHDGRSGTRDFLDSLKTRMMVD